MLFKFMKRHILTIVLKLLNVFYLYYRHVSFFAFFIFNKFPAKYAFHMCVEYDKTKQTPHGAYIGTLGLMECKKYVLYVIRKR